jgi:hypothetical protein
MIVSIPKAAAKNGISASVAYNRIKAGWSEADAVSVPTRTYKYKTKRKKKKADRVWAYLVKNPLATYVEIAKETGVSYSYAFFLKNKVGTPRAVFEAEAANDTSAPQTLGDRLRKWWNAA